MLRKKYIYNTIILLIYLIACIYIYQSNNYEVNKDKVIVSYDEKKPQVIPISNNNILAILEIPKINLKEKIYKISNQQKDVDNNVVILENSTFPVEKDSILFIAAHSGSGKNAYFNNIDKLSTGDKVKFYYKNKLFTYVVEKSWETDKDGNIEVSKHYNHELILTTCSKSDTSKQLIIKCIQKEE